MAQKAILYTQDASSDALHISGKHLAVTNWVRQYWRDLICLFSRHWYKDCPITFCMFFHERLPIYLSIYLLWWTDAYVEAAWPSSESCKINTNRSQACPEVQELSLLMRAATLSAYSTLYTVCTVNSTVIHCPVLQGRSCHGDSGQARHCLLC